MSADPRPALRDPAAPAGPESGAADAIAGAARAADGGLVGPALFDGAVTHRRLAPARPGFRHRLCWALVDIDRLAELDRRSRLFGFGRPAPVSLQPRDHGRPGHGGLRADLEARLMQAGLTPPGGPIGLLTTLRQFGYAFNPISLFFCHDRDGRLAALVYEVHNTFGDRHSYAAAPPEPIPPGQPAVLRHEAPKQLHVSPYIGMAAQYRFRLALPGPQAGARLSLAIRVLDSAGTPILATAFSGRRRALTDRRLARLLLARPGQTAKVTAAIHWQALKLHFTRLPLHRRPAPPEAGATRAESEATRPAATPARAPELTDCQPASGTALPAATDKGGQAE